MHHHNQMEHTGDKTCHSCAPATKWYKEKLFYVIVITLFFLGASYFISFLRPFYDTFMEYLRMIWWAILIGIFIGGIIDYMVPEQYVTRFLSRKRKRTILFATLFGFLMSACSHGILAIAVALHRKGASIPATVAFLLAAPWANLTITILLFGFFGLKALWLIASAIFIAMITGLIFQVLEKNGLIEQSKKVVIDENFSVGRDIKKRIRDFRFNFREGISALGGIVKESWSLTKMVLWWILIGMILASAARTFVPTYIFQDYLGASFLGLVVTLVIATIIEVCSEGSSPMAFEIFRQTGAFGNSFVFLMAGVATDYTEIGLLWSNIGKKTALWTVLITVPQIIIFGLLFNAFL